MDTTFRPVARPRSRKPGRTPGLMLIAALAATTAAPVAAQTFDFTLHVDNQHVSASDANPGTASQPLLTVQEAMDRAIANKQSATSTHVLIHPGTYREYVDVTTFTNWPSNQPNNTEPILVEGSDPNNRAVMSGAEVWTGWTQQGNLFTHSWPYDWGPYDAPWQDTIIDLTDIVLRREIVWIDDERLDPVLNQSDLAPGSFFVDEDADLLYVYPPSGVNFPQATVELAERERVWDQDYENNVTFRHLTFEKTNGPWEDGYGMVRIVGSHNVVVEDCSFRYSNWTGLYSARGDNMILRRVSVDDNGGRGLAVWRMKNLGMYDSEANRNNWRGYLQGNIPGAQPFTGWTTGGANIESVHGVDIEGYSASENFTRGIWFDTDIIDAVVESSTFDDNKNDGLFVEAAQGPIRISNSTFNNNFRHGILTGMAENVTLEFNQFNGNGLSPIRVSGADAGRGIVNFETNVYQTVLSRYWTMQYNEFYGEGPYLIGTTVGATRWAEFIGNLSSDFNDWCHPTEIAVFQRQGGQMLDLAGWRSHTGEDQSSTYCAGGVVLPVELTTLAATVEDDVVTLIWETASESNNAGFEVEQERDGFFVSIGFVDGAGTTSLASYYRYTVSDLPSGTTRFRLRQIDTDGSFSYSSVVEVAVPLDRPLSIDAFPNPVAGQSELIVTAREEGVVRVDVYDALGQLVKVLHSGVLVADQPLSLAISASDFAAGLYFVRVVSDQHAASKRIMFVR